MGVPEHHKPRHREGIDFESAPEPRGGNQSSFVPDSRRSDSDERLVYSVSEAAGLLGISRAFAYELVGRGELPVIQLGRRLLVPKVALTTLVEADVRKPE